MNINPPKLENAHEKVLFSAFADLQLNFRTKHVRLGGKAATAINYHSLQFELNKNEILITV